VRGDRRPRGEPPLQRLVGGIREVHPAEVDVAGEIVVHLDPVLGLACRVEDEGVAGGELVDHDVSRTDVVARVEGRRALDERARPVRLAGHRQVRGLLPEGHRIEHGGGPVREPEMLAAGRKLEGRVQTGLPFILVRPDDEVAVRGDRGAGGELPLRRDLRVVREEHAAERDGAVGVVVELDPVLGLARRVEDLRVAGGELVEHHLAGQGHAGAGDAQGGELRLHAGGARRDERLEAGLAVPADHEVGVEVRLELIVREHLPLVGVDVRPDEVGDPVDLREEPGRREVPAVETAEGLQVGREQFRGLVDLADERAVRRVADVGDGDRLVGLGQRPVRAEAHPRVPEDPLHLPRCGVEVDVEVAAASGVGVEVRHEDVGADRAVERVHVDHGRQRRGEMGRVVEGVDDGDQIGPGIRRVVGLQLVAVVVEALVGPVPLEIGDHRVEEPVHGLVEVAAVVAEPGGKEDLVHVLDHAVEAPELAVEVELGEVPARPRDSGIPREVEVELLAQEGRILPTVVQVDPLEAVEPLVGLELIELQPDRLLAVRVRVGGVPLEPYSHAVVEDAVEGQAGGDVLLLARLVVDRERVPPVGLRELDVDRVHLGSGEDGVSRGLRERRKGEGDQQQRPP